VEASNDETHLVLSVTNDGEPIEPHLLSKVFEPYWRPPTSVPGGGLGLGLYICKQIVEGHSGTLEVLSTTNEGTRFTARIPLT
jgi:signal transduction histidine kinase